MSVFRENGKRFQPSCAPHLAIPAIFPVRRRGKIFVLEPELTGIKESVRVLTLNETCALYNALLTTHRHFLPFNPIFYHSHDCSDVARTPRQTGLIRTQRPVLKRRDTMKFTKAKANESTTNESKERTPSKFTYFAIALSLAFVAVAGSVKAETFEGIDIKVEGAGPDLIFIPGLNSSKETFTDTCEQFKANYTCHLLTLPGFAGQAPLANLDNGFLLPVRDSILRYVAKKDLKKPVFVGHSLGGFMSLLIAEHAPNVPKALVIVDSLPFYSAIQNPAATEASVKPMAEGMKKQMLDQPLEQYRQRAAQMATMGMSNKPESAKTLVEWSQSSDRATTSQAMFELMTTDMRDRVASVKTPTLVLGAWAAYKAYGSTKESTKAIFTAQYQKLNGVQIELSETGYHFLSWDDPQWVTQQMTQFLQAQNTLAKTP